MVPTCSDIHLIPRVVQDSALGGHLHLVDDLANAGGLPGDPTRAGAVLVCRHAALEQDTALNHAERHVPIEREIVLEEEVVELRLNAQIFDCVAERAFLGHREARCGDRADDELRTAGEAEGTRQQEGERGGRSGASPQTRAPSARETCACNRRTARQGVTGRRRSSFRTTWLTTRFTSSMPRACSITRTSSASSCAIPMR